MVKVMVSAEWDGFLFFGGEGRRLWITWNVAFFLERFGFLGIDRFANYFFRN